MCVGHGDGCCSVAVSRRFELMRWMPPFIGHRMMLSSAMAAHEGGSMANAHVLSIDLAKRSFQVCATDRAGSVLYNRTISRSKLEALLKAQPRCFFAMKACPTSHF